MSFRIELSNKNGVSLFIVVVRDQVNFTFQTGFENVDQSSASYDLAQMAASAKNEAARQRDRLNQLLSNYRLDEQQKYVRGEDEEHIKRHHGFAGEVRLMHLHISFSQNVTPIILKHVLDTLLAAQNHPYDHHDLFMAIFFPQANQGNQANQFITKEIAADVLKAFESYYKEFTKSVMEQQDDHERQLTKQEKASLERAAAADTSGALSIKDKAEIALCKIPQNFTFFTSAAKDPAPPAPPAALIESVSKSPLFFLNPAVVDRAIGIPAFNSSNTIAVMG